MFFGILIITIGVAILLNALGVFNGAFWGIFWGVLFIALGIKLMIKKGMCPMCGWQGFEGKMHSKIHEKMHGHCCEGHNHGNEEQEEQNN